MKLDVPLLLWSVSNVFLKIMIITLATSLDDISISVRGISNKLRTHNRDFTCRRSKLETTQGDKLLFSTLKRVNCFLASGPIVHEMNVHWESPQLSCARNASSPATCWYIYYDACVSVCLSRKIITSFTGLFGWKFFFCEFFFLNFFLIFFLNFFFWIFFWKIFFWNFFFKKKFWNFFF